jgi:hypothetical protein
MIINSFKSGDIVAFGPKSGWWRVKDVDPKSNNRIILELVMDSKGKVYTGKKRLYSAYITWIQKVTVDSINLQKEADLKKWDTLLFILDPNQEIKNESVAKSFEGLQKPEPEYLTRLGPPPSLLRK